LFSVLSVVDSLSASLHLCGESYLRVFNPATAKSPVSANPQNVHPPYTLGIPATQTDPSTAWVPPTPAHSSGRSIPSYGLRRLVPPRLIQAPGRDGLSDWNLPDPRPCDNPRWPAFAVTSASP